MTHRVADNGVGNTATNYQQRAAAAALATTTMAATMTEARAIAGPGLHDADEGKDNEDGAAATIIDVIVIVIHILDGCQKGNRSIPPIQRLVPASVG